MAYDDSPAVQSIEAARHTKQLTYQCAAPTLTALPDPCFLSLIRRPLWYIDFGMRAMAIFDAVSLALNISGLVERPNVEPTGRSRWPGTCPP
eukprot:COSAG02_NODE_795_length_17133_cov_6.577727_15_plen_92_part_00